MSDKKTEPLPSFLRRSGSEKDSGNKHPISQQTQKVLGKNFLRKPAPSVMADQIVSLSGIFGRPILVKLLMKVMHQVEKPTIAGKIIIKGRETSVQGNFCFLLQRLKALGVLGPRLD